MKNIAFIFLLFIAIFTASCEDVIDLNLDTAEPKLVISASINWKKGSNGNQQKIILSTTTSFYNKDIPKVSGAIITVKNSSNVTFKFIESTTKGEYVCSNFIPVINEKYTLSVVSNGETYTATEVLQAVAPITVIEQNNEGGFTGDQIEIKTFYKDPTNQANYYLYRYSYSNQIKSNYYVDQDEFFNGNTFFSVSQNDDLEKGDKVDVTHFGISKQYYNYMSVLVSISNNAGGGPFQSPPATVRGNIINTTKFDNYPLGYFALSEVDTKSYIIQ